VTDDLTPEMQERIAREAADVARAIELIAAGKNPLAIDLGIATAIGRRAAHAPRPSFPAAIGLVKVAAFEAFLQERQTMRTAELKEKANG
jgi:hypothetical protein